MTENQLNLIEKLREWTIADRNQYASGFGTKKAIFLWELVIGAICECSYDEIVLVRIYASRNPRTAGFGSHDVTTAHRQKQLQQS